MITFAVSAFRNGAVTVIRRVFQATIGTLIFQVAISNSVAECLTTPALRNVVCWFLVYTPFRDGIINNRFIEDLDFC